ncbi:hypothetical protein U1Q18_015325 [Sarracenia purpurea var. burkii]
MVPLLFRNQLPRDQNRMLHLPSGGNPRLKGCKAHKSFQIALLFTICIWLLHQIKVSDNKPEAESNGKITQSCIQIGRKAGPEILVGITTDSGRDGSGPEDAGENEFGERPKSVPGDLPSNRVSVSDMSEDEEEQYFPENRREKPWGKNVSHEEKFVSRKWKGEIGLESSEIIVGLGEIEMSEFQSFDDKNGVPPWQEGNGGEKSEKNLNS